VLVLEDGGGEGFGVPVVLHEPDEKLGRLVEIGREVREETEVVVLLRNETESHGGLLSPTGPLPRVMLSHRQVGATSPPLVGGRGGARARSLPASPSPL